MIIWERWAYEEINVSQIDTELAWGMQWFTKCLSFWHFLLGKSDHRYHFLKREMSFLWVSWKTIQGSKQMPFQHTCCGTTDRVTWPWGHVFIYLWGVTPELPQFTQSCPGRLKPGASLGLLPLLTDSEYYRNLCPSFHLLRPSPPHL